MLVADARLDNREELCEALGYPPGGGPGADRRGDPAAGARAVGRSRGRAPGGDFAFAFWDSGGERLLLARDFLGQQPLHYARRDGFFAFASMPKGLHALRRNTARADREAVASFLALIPEDGSETFFKGIEKVRAGEIVRRSPGTDSRRLVAAVAGAAPPEADRGLCRGAARAFRPGRRCPAARRGVGRRRPSQRRAGQRRRRRHGRPADGAEGGRVTAFTGVPRQGYDGSESGTPSPTKAPMRPKVAAMYPNMDHVIVRNGGSPFADLDRIFFIYERPVLNLCNWVWMHRIMDVARDRGLRILLSGARGNMSFSYDGMPLLTQLLSSGRLLRLAGNLWRWSEGTRVGTVAAQTIGPFIPVPLWQAISRMRGKGRKLTDYTAISPEAAEAFRIAERAAERGLDPSYRPRRDPLETRLWSFGGSISAITTRAISPAGGYDVRDPTADRRLVEFCLAVPASNICGAGSAGRSPGPPSPTGCPPRSSTSGSRAIRPPTGTKASVPRATSSAASSGGSRPAATPAPPSIGDDALPRRQMPTEGWHKPANTQKYRLALLGESRPATSSRKAAGSNQ